MIVFPAIDLLAGNVVRLQRGDRSKVDVYSDDPVGTARRFAECGATWVHVVDLSAAFGEDEDARAANDRAIRQIAQVPGISVDVGGGVRTLERLSELVAAGASRVAIGTALVRDRAFARQAIAEFGEVLVADVAARGGVVAVDGWRQDTGVAAEELVGELAGMGLRHLVFTDVARDGMRSGIDADAYVRIARATGFPVVASGGVASIDDIRRLVSLGPDVIEGVICGRALYERTLDLREALAVTRGEEAGAC